MVLNTMKSELQLSKIKDITYILVTLLGIILSIFGAYYSISARVDYLCDKINNVETQLKANVERTNVFYEKLYALQYEFGIFKAKVEHILRRQDRNGDSKP